MNTVKAFNVTLTGVWLVALALVASLVVTVIPAAVAQTEHVPITGVDVRAYPYPQGALQACGPAVDAGAEPHVFAPDENIRIEPDVFGNNPSQPTEHWTMRLHVFEVTNPGASRERKVRLWDEMITHQNHGPGTKTPEVGQWNVYPSLHGGSGTFEVVVRVIGDESGLVFDEVCRFEVAG